MSKFLQALATGFGNPSMNRVMEKGFKRPGIMDDLGIGGFNQAADPEERILPDGTRETVGSEGILVNGTNRQPMTQEDPEYDPYYGNRRDLEARDVAMQEIEEYRKEKPRKGMFGVKGTLRDVLGFLGDTYLVGQGKDPAYQARRDQERMSDAQAGITNNPRAAAERTGYYDPETGRTIMEKAEEAELRKAQQQSLADSRNSLIKDREIKQTDKATLATQSLLATPGAIGEDGSITPAAMQALGRIATSYNTTPEALLGGLQGDSARLYSQARIDPYRQQRLEDYDQGLAQGERRVVVGERNAATSERRERKMPSGRAAPAVTDATIKNEIRGKLNKGERLSPGDQLIANQMEKDATPSSGSRPRRPSRPGAGLQIKPVRGN